MNADELCLSIGKSLPALFECAPAPRGGIRVRTPLIYPDGGMVDVFVLACGDGGYSLTDFGEALGWLRMQSVRGRRSPKQNRMIEDTCQTLGVELHRGQLVLRVATAGALGEAVLRLGQAAVRVSDLWFTLRPRGVKATVEDEVTEWLHVKEIDFKRGVSQPGRSGRNWMIDYQTHTDNRISLIFLLSTNSRSAVQRITEHVLAGCYDLKHLESKQPRIVLVSLFDDTEENLWGEKDFRLVKQQSEVACWSQPEEFEQILRTA